MNSHADGLSLQALSDPSAFAALKPEWNELLAESDADCFFLTWEWISTWWKHLGGKRRLLLLTARDGDRLVAIAPLALRPASAADVPPVACLEFLADGTIGSDHLDLIVRRGREAEVARLFAEVLGERASMVSLGRVRSGSSAMQAVSLALRSQGWAVTATRGEVCPVVRRPEAGWTEYLAGLGSEHRYAFRRKVKKLSQSFDVALQIARSDEGRREALHLLIDLHQRRWRDRGRSEAFCSPEQIAFHQELSALALQNGWLRLFILRLDGVGVAALYGFHYRRRFYFYQSGFDPDLKRMSVGLVLMGMAIKHAFDEGVDEFDLLHGDEAYKFHWTKEARQLVRLEIYPPGVRGALYRSAVLLTRTARRLARSVLRPEPMPGAGDDAAAA